MTVKKTRKKLQKKKKEKTQVLVSPTFFSGFFPTSSSIFILHLNVTRASVVGSFVKSCVICEAMLLSGERF